MAKGDNVGTGLPKGVFNSIIGSLAGAGAKGTPVERAAVFLAIAQEEHAALHPGDGTTSMADATMKYFFVAHAAEDLLAAPVGNAAQVTSAINKIVPAVLAVGKLWSDFGPVRDEFLNSVPKS